MKDLYNLKEKLCDELKSYNKKEMSSASLDVMEKLSNTIKNLDKIIDRYSEEEYGASYNSYYNRSNPNSYARGRGASRDSMGRYSSRGDGYSYHDSMVEELRDMMENAPDEKTRQELRRFIDKMETM